MDTPDPTDPTTLTEYHTTKYADGDSVTAVALLASDPDVAYEVGIALLGRAQKIHENPDDEFEDTALELRALGQQIMDQHRAAIEDMGEEDGGA